MGAVKRHQHDLKKTITPIAMLTQLLGSGIASAGLIVKRHHPIPAVPGEDEE